MSDRLETQEIATGLGVVALFVLGSAVAGPVGLVAAGVATNLLADLVDRQGNVLWRRLQGQQGLHDDALREATRRAFAKAIQRLEALWWETHRGIQMKTGAAEVREPVEGLFMSLREDADGILTDEQLGAIAIQTEMLQNIGDEQRAQLALDKTLDAYLYGHDSQLAGFVRQHLVPLVANAFADELKAQTIDGNRAWRSYQKLVHDGVLDKLNLIKATQQLEQISIQEVASSIKRLEVWAEQLSAWDYSQRSQIGEAGLDQLISDTRHQTIRAVTTESGLTRDSVEAALDQTLKTIADSEARIRDEIKSLQPDDLERLREYSRLMMSRTGELARIRVGNRRIQIDRECESALSEMAEEGSTVVVGEPGAGKSGVLHKFGTRLISERRDFVFLSVEGIAAESIGELRLELGLSCDLSEVLRSWHGDRPAFLVIDALDAARSNSTARTLIDLIANIVDVNHRWRVIVSIRKFDLRYRPDLQQWFQGEPHEVFRDQEFRDIRHISVLSLTHHELDQFALESPLLRQLTSEASPAFQDLLRMPFNLRLAADLLGSGLTLRASNKTVGWP